MNATIKVLFANLREPRVTVTTEGGFTAYSCHFLALENAVNTTRRNYEAAGYTVAGPVDPALYERVASQLDAAGFVVERKTLGFVVSLTSRAIHSSEVQMALADDINPAAFEWNFTQRGSIYVNLLRA